LRVRAHRRRLDRGAAVARVEYNGNMLDFLIRLQWLDEAKSGDRDEVGHAIERLLQESAKL
jgi:hypothetical protein